ncbi:hypothetical protein GASC598I20_000690 [Gilliamella apicola SCGC AB-598-I20]|nr:hypothetical protein GASC598I20_000690 [Gilliamella apicola SCGC AB-598-I20]
MAIGVKSIPVRKFKNSKRYSVV